MDSVSLAFTRLRNDTLYLKSYKNVRKTLSSFSQPDAGGYHYPPLGMLSLYPPGWCAALWLCEYSVLSRAALNPDRWNGLQSHLPPRSRQERLIYFKFNANELISLYVWSWVHEKELADEESLSDQFRRLLMFLHIDSCTYSSLVPTVRVYFIASLKLDQGTGNHRLSAQVIFNVLNVTRGENSWAILFPMNLWLIIAVIHTT